MGGREDYKARIEARKLRYKMLSEKVKVRSEQYSNSTANKILEMTPRATNSNRSSFRKNG